MAQSSIAVRSYRMTDIEGPDIFVADRFVNKYNDERVCLDGSTYDAKEIIKFDWETTHHKFSKARGQWIVDADSLDELVPKLESAGFEFGETSTDRNHPFFEAVENGAVGQRIRVVYEKKRGTGGSEFEGRITDLRDQISFVRDDGQHMGVRMDNDQVGLYTAMSAFPFVGTVSEIEIYD